MNTTFEYNGCSIEIIAGGFIIDGLRRYTKGFERCSASDLHGAAKDTIDIGIVDLAEFSIQESK